jgi:hypothetical protein
VLNRRRRLIEIKEIEISNDQAEQISQYKASKNPTLWSNEYLHYLRRIGVIGLCCVCYELPSKMATYKVGTAQMVERYCDKCISHIYDDLHEFYDKTVFIRYK